MDAFQQLMTDEGFMQKPYRCSEGYLTIGFGFNLDTVGLSFEESKVVLEMRINALKVQLEDRDFYSSQPIEVQDALINMAYNLGLPGLLKFKKMIAALIIKDYRAVANESLSSIWAIQVGKRANRIANVFLSFVEKDG